MSYCGNNYLLSSMLANLSNLDTPLSSVKSSITDPTNGLPAIKGDTGNLPTIVTHVSNVETNTDPLPTHLPNIDSQTSGTETNTQNTKSSVDAVKTSTDAVGTNTSIAGAGLNTQNVNNKLLTAQKASQAIGFLSGAKLSSNLFTSSSTPVNVFSVSNVPNGAKIIYNLWVQNTISNSSYNFYTRIVAGATILVSESAVANGQIIQYKDYSGTLTNSSGSTNNITMQIYVQSGGGIGMNALGNSPNISSMICYSSSNAIVVIGSYFVGQFPVIGACQLSSIAFAVLSSTTFQSIQLATLGLSSSPTVNFTSTVYPQKMQFPNGVPCNIPNGWSDNDFAMVIDFTGDLLTVN